MKAAPFRYVKPDSIEAALAALSDEPDAKVLAGGQSLVPMMAMRLARPEVLVDLAAVPGLDELTVEDDWLRIAAMVRQGEVERSQSARKVPLMHAVLPYVGHRELRNRGTICGSLAHADPSAELPAIAVTLGAVMEVTGVTGRRSVSAGDFFVGPLQTVLTAAEVVTAVRFPLATAADAYGFAEVARRHGDFALTGAAAHVRTDDGRVRHAVVGMFGVAETPVTLDAAEELSSMSEQALRSHDVLAEIGRSVTAGLTPSGDLHAGAEYRRRLAAALATRVLEQAVGNTAERGTDGIAR